MDSDKFVTRAQLYEMVWREPMSHLAARFGVSDVTLRRICERYDISRPAPGYWSKLAYGKPVEKIPLSVEKRAPTERIRVYSPNQVTGWLLSAIASALYMFSALSEA